MPSIGEKMPDIKKFKSVIEQLKTMLQMHRAPLDFSKEINALLESVQNGDFILNANEMSLEKLKVMIVNYYGLLIKECEKYHENSEDQIYRNYLESRIEYYRGQIDRLSK